MTAARYVRAGTVEVGPADAVPPAAGQVRIDVAYTGICGTDLHIFHGAMDRRVDAPAVIGHEMSGRIAQVGPGVDGWSIGDAVTVMPLDWCDACPACRAGHRHICQRLVFIGIDAPGSMQRSWTVPERTLVRLPDSLSLRQGALVEPTAVAVHDVRRAGLQPGERVLVVGGGPVGLLVAMVARSVGGEVLVVEIDPYRRSVAERLGLATIDPRTSDLEASVARWTHDAGVDAAFEVSGAQAGLDAAVDSTRARGRIVVVAIHPEPKPLDLFRVFWRELTIIGARVYERADYEQAVHLLSGGGVDVEPLISAVEPLARAADAFAALDRGGEVLKVLIDCQEDMDG